LHHSFSKERGTPRLVLPLAVWALSLSLLGSFLPAQESPANPSPESPGAEATAAESTASESTTAAPPESGSGSPESAAAAAEEEARKAAAESEGTAGGEKPAEGAGSTEPGEGSEEGAGEIDPIQGLPPEYKIKEEWPLPDFDERKLRTQINTILTAGEFSSPDEERLIEEYIKFQLARITLESERSRLRFHKDNLIKQLRGTQPPQVTSLEVHEKYLDVLSSELPKLFKNNFYVRQVAAVILENMNQRDVINSLDPNERATPYVPGVYLMLELVRDRKQLPAVKFPAIRGLVRAFNDPSVSPQTRNQIIRAFLDELRQPNRPPEPYQWKLITSLGDLKQVEDGNNRPTVAQELMLIIVDPTRSWRTRVIAAHNLSRIPLESAQGPLNLELVSIELVRLAKDMGDAYALEPDLPGWKDNFLRLYLAFNPGKAEKSLGEGLLEQIAQRSTLGKYSEIAKDSYQQILPLVNKVAFDTETIDLEKQIQQMEKWLEDHPQKSDRISPGEDPILTAVKP